MITRSNRIQDITLTAMLATVLFVQEQILSFLPNIQLTVFLIILYSKSVGFVRTSIIVLVHVILDNIVMGSFSFHYTPFMFIGLMIIPIVVCLLFKKINSNFVLAISSIFFAISYCLIMSIPNIFITEVDYGAYLLADIPFTTLLAISSFVSTLWLYNPCIECLDNLNNKNL